MAGLDPTDLEALTRVAVSAEEMAEQAEAVKLAAIRAEPREAAVARGRLYGELEADRRGEKGALKEERVNRAMAYAAWEHDGKPSGGAHLREFGVGQTGLTGVVRGGADPRPERKR